jgi:PIN domain nuclease of toxin-antitoxin system
VSAVAGIEIATKVRKGKLPTMAEALERFDELVDSDSFQHLPISRGHAIRAGLLEGDHRDPFDRLIAAQALLENLVVVTRDAEIAGFGCKVLW